MKLASQSFGTSVDELTCYRRLTCVVQKTSHAFAHDENHVYVALIIKRWCYAFTEVEIINGETSHAKPSTPCATWMVIEISCFILSFGGLPFSINK